jgi:hypothetical protein
MGYQIEFIFQQAVNEDPELFTEARAQITAAVYTMWEGIVRFHTPSCTSQVVKEKRRWWQEKLGAQGVRVLMFFLSVYGFPLGLWFSFGFMGFPLSLLLCFSFKSTSVSFH